MTLPTSEKQILLQRVMALRRLAKIAVAHVGTPDRSEIDAWAEELDEYIKHGITKSVAATRQKEDT